MSEAENQIRNCGSRSRVELENQTTSKRGKAVNEPIQHRSRAEAIASRVLIDVTSSAKEVGILVPAAMTAAAWVRCVAVPGTVRVEVERSRLRELLERLFVTVRIGKGGQETRFPVFVEDEKHFEVIQLKALLGRGDHGE